MLDAKQVIEKMKERGFTETMRSVRNEYIPITITFSPMKLDGTDVLCTVNLDEETFQFFWAVPQSICTLQCPSCSAFFDDNHFSRIYRKMNIYAKILHYELRGE